MPTASIPKRFNPIFASVIGTWSAPPVPVRAGRHLSKIEKTGQSHEFRSSLK